MSDFSNSELRRLDLTVLLVLLGLIHRRKASEVAVELGLTPSAVSQALKRLRDIFGDELFLRRPHGLEPTATAMALEAPVAAAVEALRGALGATQRFDPTTARSVVRLAALDAQQAVLIPPLSARLRVEAPGLRLSVLPLARSDAVDALVEARADLAIGYVPRPPEVLLSAELYRDGYLVAGPPASLPNAPHITLDAYCATDHILVAPGGDLQGIVDSLLSAMGRSRRITLSLSAFLPALAASAATGALVTLPARVAASFASGFNLVNAAPPLAIRPYPVSVLWHRRNTGNPEIAWLREQVLAAVRTIATGTRA